MSATLPCSQTSVLQKRLRVHRTEPHGPGACGTLPRVPRPSLGLAPQEATQPSEPPLLPSPARCWACAPRNLPCPWWGCRRPGRGVGRAGVRAQGLGLRCHSASVPAPLLQSPAPRSPWRRLLRCEPGTAEFCGGGSVQAGAKTQAPQGGWWGGRSSLEHWESSECPFPELPGVRQLTCPCPHWSPLWGHWMHTG